MPDPRPLTHNGQTLPVREWARRTGLHFNTILGRLRRGWTVADALRKTPDARFQPGYQPPPVVVRPVPPLREHTSGQACARWSELGADRVRYFGPWGSPEAAANYARFAAEWAAGGGSPAEPGGLSVAELVRRWLEWGRSEYTKGGRPTSEVQCCRAAVRHLVELYGDTHAGEFGPLRLKAVRDRMIAAGWVRHSINLHCGRIVRCFRWGVSEGLVEPDVWQALKAVAGLRSGRGAVAERPPREAARDADVDGTIEHLHHRRRAEIGDMIRLQRLTGMRPGEVCAIRADEIDRTADVWVYRPPAHKTLHKGKTRRIHFGPRAQAIIAPRLVQADGGRLFRITVSGYGAAIRAACQRAGVTPWTPHQLRHSLATEVARRYSSLATAAAAIGDTAATAARHYVHVDPDERAKIDVARDMG